MAALCRYDYPGNVRELRNLIEFALIASRGGPIGVGHLHFLSGSPVAIPGATPTPHTADEDALVDYARDHGRIDNAAAQALLRIDHGRASYLLKKLHKDRRLTKQGERRWTYYTAS